MKQRQDQRGSASPTIVGGQPSRRPTAVQVPVGVERALYLAAVDGDFRTRLLRDRDAAALAAGLRLRGSEAATLRHAPAAQLAAAIDRLDTSVANLERRGFMQAVAATAVAVAAGAAVGCGDGGSEKERDAAADGGSDGGDLTVDSPMAMDGIQPDMPPITPDAVPDKVTVDSPLTMDGIQPDMPPIKQDAVPDKVTVDTIFGPDSAGILPDK